MKELYKFHCVKFYDETVATLQQITNEIVRFLNYVRISNFVTKKLDIPKNFLDFFQTR